MTAKEWVQRALETLDARTREEDDAALIDAHDDLCNALAAWPAETYRVRVTHEETGFTAVLEVQAQSRDQAIVLAEQFITYGGDVSDFAIEVPWVAA